MKTSILKKSLLDYAIKGNLSSKFRKSNPNLNAFDEINAYNAQILKDKKSKEKEIKEAESKRKTEKDKELKQILKSQIQTLKKEIVKIKTITPLNADSAPFPIPPSWAWVRLGDIGEIFTGTTPKTTKVDNFGNFIPFLGPGDIDDMGNVCYDNKGLSQIGLQEARKIQVNSVLVTCIGGLIGKSCIVDRECTCNQQINIITPYSCVDFRILYYFINSQYFQILMQENSTGTATPIINKTLFENLLIPLPPLSEQKEIVSILDSLIGLADSFDKTKEELKRIEKRIEKSLLQYAILGKLSSKWRRDISASPQYDKIPNAFDEIESYNAQILKNKKAKEQELKELESNLKIEKDKETKQILKQKIQNLKKDITKLKTIVPLNKDISLVSQAQYDKDAFIPPFAIPKTWTWVRLGEVCEIVNGVSISNLSLPIFDVKYLRTKNDKQLASNGNMVCMGDRLILMDGENSGEIFIATEKGFLGSTLKKLNFTCLVKAEFMDYILLHYKDFFKGNKKGAAIPHLDRNLFLNLEIPLPPLKEQQEIIRTLDALFALTKGLKCE